jgi:acyl-CoA synthetase (AMP-forming)/AMP-acid ligase II
MEARIMRDDGTDADTNEPGELWLRGGNVALGYWNNEKANKETFVKGWVHTGDTFRVDAGGNFWFVSSNLLFFCIWHLLTWSVFPSIF